MPSRLLQYTVLCELDNFPVIGVFFACRTFERKEDPVRFATAEAKRTENYAI
jgi:hypothetical protein